MGDRAATPDRRARARQVLRSLAVGAALLSGCGVTPDSQIADEFHERLQREDRGGARVPCRDRAAKVERTRHLVAMAQDLRAHLRHYADPPPPELVERMTDQPMLGRAEDYRCVVQDFTRIDLNTEPDLEDVRGLVGTLYMLMGRHLMQQGRKEDGWAHVLEAVELYRRPVAPGIDEHISLFDVLKMMAVLLDEYPPSRSTIDALVAAIDDTAVPARVGCSALRRTLLVHAAKDFRLHFGQRERELFAKRFGLDFAMRTWNTPQRVGAHQRAEWQALRDAHDLMIDGCAERPYGLTLKRAAAPMARLDVLHPFSGAALRISGEQLHRLGQVTDKRISMLARLRARSLQLASGREPTTAQLALSFGRRPRSPWDRRWYSFVVHDGEVTVSRGAYRYRVPIEPRTKPPTGRSYAEGPRVSR